MSGLGSVGREGGQRAAVRGIGGILQPFAHGSLSGVIRRHGAGEVAAEFVHQIAYVPSAVQKAGFGVEQNLVGERVALAALFCNPCAGLRHDLHQPQRAHVGTRVGAIAGFDARHGGEQRGIQRIDLGSFADLRFVPHGILRARRHARIHDDKQHGKQREHGQRDEGESTFLTFFHSFSIRSMRFFSA